MPKSCRTLALAALVVSLASCTDSARDVDKITEPGPRGATPVLPLPTLRITPTFATPDSLARYARGVVVGQLNRVLLQSREIESAHATLNSGGWSEARPGCQVVEIAVPADTSCSYVLWACTSDDGLEFSEVIDGPCVPGELPFSDWIRFSGFSTEDGTNGDFRSFDLPRFGGGVSRSWSWRMSADHRVVDWSFYNGDRSDRNFAGTLHWDRSDARIGHGEFRWSSGQKWTADLSVDGTFGRMTILGLDRLSGTWLPQEEINWRPAHGAWNTYDSAGALVENRAW